MQSEPVGKIDACLQCGRLLADEGGPLCDRCDPPPVRFEAVEEPPGFHAWATWLLIAVTTVASALALGFTHEARPPGAIFGPPVAHGEWWLLLTAVFVHYSLGHWFWNMGALWFLGRYLERIVGAWTFLGFYLACGAIGNLVELFSNPEGFSAGASGAVFGICGGLIVYYAMRFRQLSRWRWIKLAALAAYVGLGIWGGRYDPTIGQADHVGGLAAGVVLGAVLTLRMGQAPAVRCWVFACTGVLIAIAAISFRENHPYLSHLDAAARALQGGQRDVAVRELHTALAMKPDSPVGQFLSGKLWQKREDVCRVPKLDGRDPKAVPDTCSILQCDGRRHALAGEEGSTLYYTWSTLQSHPEVAGGMRREKVMETMMVEAVDSFGQPICAQGWMRQTVVRSRSDPAAGEFSKPDFSKIAWQPFGPRLLDGSSDSR